ncbi:MAG: COX15/CtaA family protein [Burkholderiaceae bacterium]|nr:COX15/CtaA family protein [Burkholderiaceae bacterium]
MTRALALVACLLTVCITASSAFIRHWQNGVGCEAWPACYRALAAGGRAGGHEASAGGAAGGQTAVSSTGAAAATPTTPAPAQAGRGAIDAAVAGLARIPDAEAPASVQVARALHRVSASLVGVLVLLVVALGWSRMGGAGRVAAVVALADTAFLAWLGRYTPHDLPLVTLGNLVGGLLLAAALAWIAAEQRVRRGSIMAASGTLRIALAALALLGLLAWGGTMIGARHAIDACATPLCAGGARFDAAAFDPTRATVAVDGAAARGLHLAHRVAGLALAAMVMFLALRLRAVRPAMSAWLALLAAVQLLLGTGTALGTQPLLTTTAHNAIAALLAVALAAAAAGAAVAPSRSA